MGVSAAMSIATRALLVSQGAMDVHSHNMSNIDTEGYSRQELIIQAAPTYRSGFGEIGTGVEAQGITRLHDSALTRNLIDKTGDMAMWESEQDIIWTIETIFNESLDQGLNKAFSEFWNAWQEVGNNPEGYPERINLLESSQALTNGIANMRQDFDNLKVDLNSSITETLEEVNVITHEIASLNNDIVRVEAGNANANDMRDQRDLLLKNLSALTDVNYFEDTATGHLYVITTQGIPLVEENYASTLGADLDAAGNVRVTLTRASGTTMDITESVTEGKLGGLIEMRQKVLPEYEAQFDNICATLIQEVNRQHSQGVGLVNFTDAIGTAEVSAYAKLRIDLAGENNGLVFTSRSPGADGDEISITLLDPNTANGELSVNVSGNDITISLATNSLGSIITSAADLSNFINHDASAADVRGLIAVNLISGETGEGYLTAMDNTNLNRELGDILAFGDEVTEGSFDIVVYDADGNAMRHTVAISPSDTREDLLSQIGQTVAEGIAGLKASIYSDFSGIDRLRIQAADGYSFAFAGDDSGVLMALGVNTFFQGYDANTIEVNQYVLENHSLVAAGKIDEQGYAYMGDNENALAVADLKDTAFDQPGGAATISEMYNSLTADVGSTARTIYRQYEFSSNLVNQLQNERDATTGVNLDEELTYMLQTQYAYMAAAKVINISDEMLETMLSLI